MLDFNDAARPGDTVGIDPERVDYVLGEAPDWRFPALLALLALTVTLALAGLGVLAGAEASGTATLAPPFLSSRPCVIVLGAIPGLLAMVGLRLRRGTPRTVLARQRAR
ncbi:MAG: hypothetical protein ACXVUE_12995 [Solirubrobacteraceae bacterium]